MKKWDIYIANVPFEDLPTSKLRPVIIINDKTYTVECIKMTSKSPRPGEYALQKWKEAGLLCPTTVRITKCLILPCQNFKKRIGSLQAIDIFEIQKKLAL